MPGGLDPAAFNVPIATIKVKQTAIPGNFFMKGEATYQGTNGTCSLNGNTECSNAPGETCTVATEATACGFSAVTGTATGNANLTPLDAFISITPATATNAVNTNHVLTITVTSINEAIDAGAVTGPAAQFQGNVCVADNGKRSMSGENFLTNPGEVLLEVDATCSGCKVAPNPPADGKNGNVNSIDQPVDLTPDVDACAAARANNTPPAFGGTGPACTETISTLQQIAVNGVILRTGANLICITNQQELKKDILLTGDATTRYVFVMAGKFKFNQAKALTDCTPPQVDPLACTAAAVGPDDVTWLFVGNNQELSSSGGGGGVGCCKAAMDGNVIIDGKIALSPGLINGVVCGSGDWAFVSGSGAHCPQP